MRVSSDVQLPTGGVARNPVLAEIVATGRTLLETGESVQATSYIDEACGKVLQTAVTAGRPSVGVEIGLGFGISTLYILSAMHVSGGERLIGIDPAQHDSYWRGGGLHNIRRAGYEALYEFHENTSQLVLPAMVERGQRVQFAFIDGWHTFDHTLVDFFYVDQMLEPGGIVAFDDVGYPAIRRVCDFILTNRQYEIVDCVRLRVENRMKRRVKAKLGKLLDPVVRTDKTPVSGSKEIEAGIDDVYFLVLRKLRDDQRRFDHFVQF